MYLRFSIGFLIASLVQAGIILITESLNISSLNPKVTIAQLILHILTGQIAGFLLWYVMKNVKSIGKTDPWITGVIYGVALWVVVLSINSMRGVVESPWSTGIATVLSSILAFIAFGIIASVTIKRNERIEAQ